VIKQKPEVLEN